jgi:hypothetical protein
MERVAEQKAEELPYTLQQLAGYGLDALLGPTEKPLKALEDLLLKAVAIISPGLDEQQTRANLAASIREASVKHSDFTEYVEGMAIVALSFLPYPPRVSGPEYVELLYTAAKFCDFMAAARWRVLMNQNPTGGIQ